MQPLVLADIIIFQLVADHPIAAVLVAIVVAGASVTAWLLRHRHGQHARAAAQSSATVLHPISSPIVQGDHATIEQHFHQTPDPSRATPPGSREVTLRPLHIEWVLAMAGADGRMTRVKYLGGQYIMIGNRELHKLSPGRELTELNQQLDMLFEWKIIQPITRELYELTSAGWKAADEIRQQIGAAKPAS